VTTRLETILREGLRSSQIGGDLEAHGSHSMGFVAFESGPAFGGTIVDLGSGVGLPALVLADAFPETKWTLIERREGRADLLRRAVVRLGWSDRVEVISGDAGDSADGPIRGSADWVTARSFGPPGLTAELGSPFLKTGGRLLTSVLRDDQVPDGWPAEGLARCGLEVGERWETPAGAYRSFRRTASALVGLPRRGARKRLLF